VEQIKIRRGFEFSSPSAILGYKRIAKVKDFSGKENTRKNNQ